MIFDLDMAVTMAGVVAIMMAWKLAISLVILKLWEKSKWF